MTSFLKNRRFSAACRGELQLCLSPYCAWCLLRITPTTVYNDIIIKFDTFSLKALMNAKNQLIHWSESGGKLRCNKKRIAHFILSLSFTFMICSFGMRLRVRRRITLTASQYLWTDWCFRWGTLLFPLYVRKMCLAVNQNQISLLASLPLATDHRAVQKWSRVYH